MNNYHLCAMNCHYRFYQLESFFRCASRLGFKHVEIWTAPQHFFMDYQQYEDPDKLIGLAEKFNVRISCICPEQTNPKPNNIAIKDKEGQKRVLRYFKNAIDVSKTVGANKVVITSGWAFYDEDVKTAKDRSIAMLKEISNYAASKDVYLAMEALQKGESTIANMSLDLKEIIKEVGNNHLKVCLDLGAMAGANETIEDYFRVFHEDIIHCHFVDGNPTGHLAWGDGSRDMEEDLKVFDIFNYSGFLSLEFANDRYFQEPFAADKKTMTIYKNIKKGKSKCASIS